MTIEKTKRDELLQEIPIFKKELEKEMPDQDRAALIVQLEIRKELLDLILKGLLLN